MVIVARVLEVPGALSQGRTRQEARENVVDALRLMLAPRHGTASNVAPPAGSARLLSACAEP